MKEAIEENVSRSLLAQLAARRLPVRLKGSTPSIPFESDYSVCPPLPPIGASSDILEPPQGSHERMRCVLGGQLARSQRVAGLGEPLLGRSEQAFDESGAEHRSGI